MVRFDTPASAIALYALYWLVTAVVPGTLLWRMLGIRPRSALEEIAAGSVLGLGLQVFLTFVLAHLGVSPRLAVLWCLGVIVACLAVPRLRRLWRSSAAQRVSPWMSWSLAAVSVVSVWWIANSGYRADPIERIPGFPGQYFAPNPYPDFPFHQALTSAVLRGASGFPYVPGVPLRYEMMVYYHFADFTRWTGVDITLIVMRLYPVPLLVLAIVLCGVLAHRIAGSAIAGALGGALGYLTAPISIYAGVLGPFGSVMPLNSGVYRSPTQTFGQPIFEALLLLVVILLSERLARRWAIVAAVAVLAFVAGGAKATFLPLLICGLVVVLVIGWIVRARKTWVSLGLLAIAGAAFAAAVLFVLGADSRGLTISNGTDLLSRLSTSQALGPIIDRPVVRVAAISVVAAAWLLSVIGLVGGLVLRRRDLGVWLFTGIGVAGVGAAILGQHPALSQTYFLRSAWPLAGVVAAVGLTELGRRCRGRRWVWLVLLASLVAGLALALIVRAHSALPTMFAGVVSTYPKLVLPFVIVIAVALVAGAAVVVATRAGSRRGAGVARVAAMPLGLLVVFGLVQGSAFSEIVTGGGLPPGPMLAVGEGLAHGLTIPADGAAAARWLRAHSQQSDVVVTNQHCLDVTARRRGCVPTQFWISALSERNVLLEGWAYSTPSQKVAPNYVDGGAFWNQELLAENDAAIFDPSPQTVAWLRSQGVKWVFVDRVFINGVPMPESPDLKNYLDLAYERGDFAIYRVPRAS